MLRDDGMSYGDYVKQLTYRLFLKMADERSAPPYNQPSIVPAAWSSKNPDGRWRAYSYDELIAADLSTEAAVSGP